MTSESRAGTIAIARDGAGRRFFISIDGHRFREVSHFPGSAEQAQKLFHEGTRRELGTLELERDYRGRIAFMSVIE